MLLQAAQGVDLGPIVAIIGAVIGSSALTAALTLRATNRKLQAEGEKLYQDALAAAAETAAKNIATIDRIREVLEKRLEATEKELASTRRALEVTEERLRSMRLETEIVARERDAAVTEAAHERELLMVRVKELEAQVADLRAQVAPGRRRRDT
jgi:chromosome segregation ATPase